MSALIVHCSCPDLETAGRIAGALVEERLAACVQALPGMVSTYRWGGRVERADEILLLIKTTRARLAALKLRVGDLHPHDVPELLAIDVVDGRDSYLDWIGAATAAP
ncbi:MAG: divalent-cation tolerance protein CutA [Xanthomonadales bacterium]|nr:divalent-cation tolerance protein CutA [Xanthomonadales bacterium]